MMSCAPSGFDTVSAVACGDTSVSAVVDEALDRVRSHDDAIQAFRVIDETAVLTRGKELDEQPFGALHGLLVGIKDVIDTADLPTGYGSSLFTEHRPTKDAHVVTALRDAGAVVFGKTETCEFGMFQPTRTRNPHDPTRTPGGSSSGSAAAVAAGMVHVALGAQTAGSVIRPGAYCGVYGYKPARGWTSSRGVWKLAESLDTVGLFARTATDLRLLYDALRTRPRRLRRPRGGRHAVVLRPREWAEYDDVVDSALDEFIERMRASGWDVREMRLPSSWRRLPEIHKLIMGAEVARSMHDQLGARIDLISESAREIVRVGDATSAPDYFAARDAREAALQTLRPLAEVADLLMLPSAQGVAPVGLAFTGDPVMCRPWSLLELPASNVPGCIRDGLPVGVQMVGLSGDDDDFLDHLAAVEASLTGAERAQ